MSGSVIKTFADERLLASNLGISFFLSNSFGVAVKGKAIVLKTYPSPTASGNVCACVKPAGKYLLTGNSNGRKLS